LNHAVTQCVARTVARWRGAVVRDATGKTPRMSHAVSAIGGYWHSPDDFDFSTRSPGRGVEYERFLRCAASGPASALDSDGCPLEGWPPWRCLVSSLPC